MNTEAFLAHLRGEILAFGTQAAAARKWGVSPAFLSDVLTGRRAPTERLASAVGYLRIVTFEPEVSILQPGIAALPILLDDFQSRQIEPGLAVADLATAQGAWGWCGEACHAFRQYLAEWEIRSERVMLAGLPDFVIDARTRHFGPTGLCERDLYDMEIHFVVLVRGCLVNWTARQYWPDAPFPHCYTVVEAEQTGWAVYCKPDDPSDEDIVEHERFLTEKLAEVESARTRGCERDSRKGAEG